MTFTEEASHRQGWVQLVEYICPLRGKNARRVYPSVDATNTRLRIVSSFASGRSNRNYYQYYLPGPNSRIISEHPWLLERTTSDSHLITHAEQHSTLTNSTPSGPLSLQPSGLNRLETDFHNELRLLVQRCLPSQKSKELQSPSTLIAGLLSTIHVLQEQVDALSENLNGPNMNPGLNPDQGHPHCKILHRVFCDQTIHCHDQVVYEDEPHFDGYMDWGNEQVLRGYRPIFNVETYLNQQGSIHFVIFKEHSCIGTKRAEGSKSVQVPNKRQICKRRERLRILSSSLHKTLIEATQTERNGPIFSSLREMEAPYNLLFHYQSNLEGLAQEGGLPGETLTGLLNFVNDNYKEEYDDARSMFKDGFVSNFHLSKLFKPNQVVLARSEQTGIIRAAMLSKCTSRPSGGLSMQGWCWTYDGVRFIKVYWSGDIDVISEEPIPIIEMPIYPYEFAPYRLAETIKTRGVRYRSLSDRAYLSYSGWDVSRTREYPGTRVMIDLQMYHSLHLREDNNVFIAPRDSMGPFSLSARPAVQDDNEYVLAQHGPTSMDKAGAFFSEEMCLLLPPIIEGFDMVEKRWISLDVQNLHPIEWNDRAFRELVLPSKQKDMISALLTTHDPSSERPPNDFIQGKGLGLIMLFHGAPGSGKTLTAECVAEQARKPLYRVSCGDLGTEPQQVEKHLESVFVIARTWNSVVLLDEADTFLEERTLADLQRNALISIFLRVLEYYEGILILTSNRVGMFDSAFRSRIHLSLHFDALNYRARARVWENFFRRLKKQEKDIDYQYLMDSIDGFAAELLNGRQIRNAVSTAVQLAAYRGQRLDPSHVRETVRASQDFNRYLDTIYGHSDEEFSHGNR